MAKQMVQPTSSAGEDRLLGWLSWWTLRKGEYPLDAVQESAQNAGVPDYIIERLTARSPESAWRNATNLGSIGASIPSAPGEEQTQRRLVTRNAVPGDSSIRCLVLEVNDPNGGSTEKWVTSKTAAVLEYRSGFTIEWADWVKDDPRKTDMEAVANGMESEMSLITGKIDDGRIRSSILSWLAKNHRVTVRGAGGVYFIPHFPTSQSAADMVKDLLAIRDWLATISSPFSVVAMNESGAYSVEDFAADAVEEITSEMEEIASKLMKWERNESMNDGSKAYSSQTQIERLEGLQEKVNALTESLGEKVGVVSETLNLTLKRAKAMRSTSVKRVNLAKARRAKKKKAPGKEKKSGTASRRKRSKKVE